MKKYALLAGLCLMLFISSCAKDELDTEIENMDLDLIKMNNKDRDTSKVDNWNKHLRNNSKSDTLSLK